MPHLDPTLPTLAELTRMVEASWLTAKPQPTPWPVIERRSLRRLIARVRLHRRRAARCAAPGLRLPASASGDDWRVDRSHLAGSAGADQGLEVSKICDSARGEECTIQIDGCPGDPAMTIWSHQRSHLGGKGLGIKACDLAGAYACTYCDAIYDGQRRLPPGWTREDVDAAWTRGHFRSLKRLTDKGIVK